MKKIIAIGMALFSLTAFADNEMSYAANDAGGHMFFTYSYCVYKGTETRVPNKFYMYSTNSSGKKIQDGCYEYKPPFYLIEWNSGGNTAISTKNTISLLK